MKNEILTLSENPDINYLAQIVKLNSVQKHPNAEKLQVVDISGQKVITGLDAKIGDNYVYQTLNLRFRQKQPEGKN